MWAAMLRFFYACLLGIIAAGIVHLAILFLLPSYSVHDAWSRLSSVAGHYETVNMGGRNAAQSLPVPENPFIEASACRYNLEDGPLHIRSQGNVPFWSLAIYDERGLNTFSVSDRVSNGPILDVAILTPLQMQRLQGAIPEALGQALFLETTKVEGFVLVRAFVPDETWQPTVRAFLNEMRCEPLENP
jgi:uncharacterized membrane protein